MTEPKDPLIRIPREDGTFMEFRQTDRDEDFELLFKIYLCLKFLIQAKKDGNSDEAKRLERELVQRVEGYRPPVYCENSGKRMAYKGCQAGELKNVVHFSKIDRQTIQEYSKHIFQDNGR